MNFNKDFFLVAKHYFEVWKTSNFFITYCISKHLNFELETTQIMPPYLAVELKIWWILVRNFYDPINILKRKPLYFVNTINSSKVAKIWLSKWILCQGLSEFWNSTTERKLVFTVFPFVGYCWIRKGIQYFYWICVHSRLIISSSNNNFVEKWIRILKNCTRKEISTLL